MMTLTSEVLPTIELVDEVPADARCVVRIVVPVPRDPLSPSECADVVALSRDGLTEILAGWDRGTAEELRRAAGAGVRASRRHDHVAVDLRLPQADWLPALLGAVNGAYHLGALRSAERPALSRLSLVVDDPDRARVGVEIARSTAWVRQAVDAPSSHKTPALLADAIVAIATSAGLTAQVWDEQRLRAERCGAILGVAQGSEEQPRLVKLEYLPANARAHIALVGKGVCFDSGGLVLKDARQMLGMKGDMAGAATAAGAAMAVARLGADVALTCWLPLVENMPSGSAIRVEDVVATRSGKTIEVVDTDAEGRLILADALALAAEQQPDAIIDLATLTGSVVAGLGPDVSAFFANDDALARRIERCADRSGEPQWRLPIVDAYRPKVLSSLADLRNSLPNGGVIADGILAALLLREFVDGVPWVHVDFAGPAYAEDSRRDRPAGGTGFCVATLVDLILTWE